MDPICQTGVRHMWVFDGDSVKSPSVIVWLDVEGRETWEPSLWTKTPSVWQWLGQVKLQAYHMDPIKDPFKFFLHCLHARLNPFLDSVQSSILTIIASCTNATLPTERPLQKPLDPQNLILILVHGITVVELSGLCRMVLIEVHHGPRPSHSSIRSSGLWLWAYEKLKLTCVSPMWNPHGFQRYFCF